MKKFVKCKKDYYWEGDLYYEVGKNYSVRIGYMGENSPITIIGEELALTDKQIEEYFDNVHQLRKKKIAKLLSETVQDI
jgi:hypothetical protein